MFVLLCLANEPLVAVKLWLSRYGITQKIATKGFFKIDSIEVGSLHVMMDWSSGAKAAFNVALYFSINLLVNRTKNGRRLSDSNHTLNI